VNPVQQILQYETLAQGFMQIDTNRKVLGVRNSCNGKPCTHKNEAIKIKSIIQIKRIVLLKMVRPKQNPEIL
jgi:hypothetical protein